tara:strand:- start:1685 stop:1822 length:138 start_codon:yes stop_codon:yes gene_type:complete
MKSLSLALSYASAITSSIVATITHLWNGNTSLWQSETEQWQNITG